MATVSLESVRKEFAGDENTIIAVDDVSIEVEDGEFLVLVGPSGSGKSTLLRLVSGLEELSAGTLSIGDTDITDVKPKNRDIAMVFQNYALYPHLSSRKNISFGLRMQGELSDEEIDERVEQTAEIMEIGHLLEKMPGDLSGGQQQRVALGRAIVRNPKAFLMDEPLSNLDAKLRTTMRTEIQQLQSELDVTTIYVTHDQTEAMTMGDRIAIMNEGELQQIATPLEAYYAPSNAFVAGFIGSPSMNFIEITVTETDDLTLEHPEFTFRPSSELDMGWADSREEAILGIRPEDVRLVEQDVENAIEVTVDVVEPLGKEQLLYFSLSGETHIASIEARQSVSEGQQLSILFPEDRIHVFDAGTTEALVNQSPPAEGDETLVQKRI
ncbi:ABC transporter ATP-binding protein [Halopelagius fulvigenes]|uniref:ABC-type D-xylose/L-arabinose transporter n=1 Tax=Halopelagius fulvigenes TaxID=1198324 RepID=A0ABD5TXB9_9EURY